MCTQFRTTAHGIAKAKITAVKILYVARQPYASIHMPARALNNAPPMPEPIEARPSAVPTSVLNQLFKIKVIGILVTSIRQTPFMAEVM